MPQYESIDRQEQKDTATTAVEQYLDNPDLHNMVYALGYEGDMGAGCDTRLTDLHDYSAAHWDMRNGRERWEVEPKTFSAQQKDAIMRFAHSAGMLASSRPTIKPNISGVLGGGHLTPLLRTRYFLELGVTPEIVALMGAARPVLHDEQPSVARYAPKAINESDMMEGAYEHLTGKTPVARHVLPSLPERRFDNFYKDRNTGAVVPLDLGQKTVQVTYYDGVPSPVFSLSAAKRSGDVRPNTSDTYDLLTSLAGDEYLGPGKNLQLVTGAVYVPSQRFDAINRIVLRTGAAVEMVGYYSGIEPQPHEVVQEVNSALRSAKRLIQEVAKL